ncbi:MAG TPA: arsenite S-adenosylmethyltransferase [Chloroflexi bacterium]|nr:arsenite S-adenosylmethyltransferase [Chloroflexota bacterium]
MNSATNTGSTHAAQEDGNPSEVRTTRERVRDHYASQARAAVARAREEACCGGPAVRASSCGVPPVSSGCCGAETIPVEELPVNSADEVPPSWGCGNPTALAALQPGQVVLDLGSGAGFAAFLAARRVAGADGPAGRVIGVDMTDEMLALARRHAERLGLADVTEFRQGYIEALPVEDESVDVILSNCVINLSADKDAVFREAYRVLKPGGWLSVSDIVTEGTLPAFARKSIELWASCIGGAIEEQTYLEKVRAAGFEDVEIAGRRVSAAFPGVKAISLTFRAYKPAAE